MEIEVGKEYITASGDIVLISYSLEKCNYKYQDNRGSTYTENGNMYRNKISEYDLICEVVPSIYALYSSGIIDLKELIKQHIEYYTK